MNAGEHGHACNREPIALRRRIVMARRLRLAHSIIRFGRSGEGRTNAFMATSLRIQAFCDRPIARTIGRELLVPIRALGRDWCQQVPAIVPKRFLLVLFCRRGVCGVVRTIVRARALSSSPSRQDTNIFTIFSYWQARSSSPGAGCKFNRTSPVQFPAWSTGSARSVCRYFARNASAAA